MNRHPRSDEGKNATRYLRQIDDTYVYDSASGLYKPKSADAEARSQDQQHGRSGSSPFFVNIRRDWLAIGISFLTLLAVAIYAYYAARQWTEMKKAAEAAKKSADIAACALESNTEALHLTERAWVGVERVDGDIRLGADEPLNLKVTYINSGRAPALKLHVATETDCEPEKIVPKIIYTEQDAMRDGHFVLVPGQEYKSTFENSNSKTVCSPANMELIRIKRGFFYILGTLWYYDAFNIKHHTDFCTSIQPGSVGYKPCRFHNDAD